MDYDIKWARDEAIKNYQTAEKDTDKYRWFCIWMKLSGYASGRVGDEDETVNTDEIQRVVRRALGKKDVDIPDGLPTKFI